MPDTVPEPPRQRVQIPSLDDPDAWVPGELLSVEPRLRQTGVIVGFDQPLDADTADHIKNQLTEAFPGVSFVVAHGCRSIAFEWDEPDAERKP